MSWNNPIESITEKSAEALGDFLIRRGDRLPHEIARTQEILRDFSQFICKDIHLASTQDYTVYRQLHVLTADDAEDYDRMLGDIREFCSATGGDASSEEATPQPVRKSPRVRQRAMTSQMQPTDDIMALLMSPDMDENNPYAARNRAQSEIAEPNIPAAGRGQQSLDLSLEETNIPSSMNRARQSFHSPIEDLNDLDDPNMTRPRFDAMGDSAMHHTPSYSEPVSRSFGQPAGDFVKNADPGATPVPERRDSISQRFSQFDFSIEKSLSGERRSGQQNPKVGTSASIQPESNNFSAFFPPVTKEDDSSLNFKHDDIASHIAEDDMSEGLLGDHVSLANNELLRGVSGVDYNFNQANLEGMRRGELHKIRSAKQQLNAPNPIDLSLTEFRPYTFEDKYTIDIPSPQPEKYKRYELSALMRWFMPLVPVIVGLAVTLLVMTFSMIAGCVFLGITLICLVLVLPDVMPASQQTPLSLLTSYFKARRGRCHVIGLSMLAVPSDSAQDIDLQTSWNDGISWLKAIANRFSAVPKFDTRIVSGSEVQNTLLMLCIFGSDYWLVPLVRVNNAWFIAGVSLSKHTIAENG